MLRQAGVSGMLELRDFQAFKGHLRDLLVQTKAFASQDDADQFAGDAAQKRAAEQVRPPAAGCEGGVH